MRNGERYGEHDCYNTSAQLEIKPSSLEFNIFAWKRP
jgi:hypothetical protein